MSTVNGTPTFASWETGAALTVAGPGTDVRVGVGPTVGVGLGVAVGLGVRVIVGVGLGPTVNVGVGNGLSVGVGVSVGVGEGPGVGVGAGRTTTDPPTGLSSGKILPWGSVSMTSLSLRTPIPSRTVENVTVASTPSPLGPGGAIMVSAKRHPISSPSVNLFPFQAL